MINTLLPYEVEIDGETYRITKNGSFDVMLDIYELLNDDDFDDVAGKEELMMWMFYDGEIPESREQAINEMYGFLNMYEPDYSEPVTEIEKRPVMDIVKDFFMYVSSVNSVLGYDIRSPEHFTHWWTFLGALDEIDSNSYYAQVVETRRKIRDEGFGKLSKGEKEFYQHNKKKIELISRFSAEEEEFFKALGFGD